MIEERNRAKQEEAEQEAKEKAKEKAKPVEREAEPAEDETGSMLQSDNDGELVFSTTTELDD